MGKKHFREEQIAFVLRQAESGTSVAEIIRTLGISAPGSACDFETWRPVGCNADIRGSGGSCVGEDGL
jgi:hypothetical protein